MIFLAKITPAVSDYPRPLVDKPGVGAAPGLSASVDGIDMAQVRDAIRTERKLRIRYCDETGRSSERIVWPVFVGYFEATRLIAAWCEVRGAFFHLHTDRIIAGEFMTERFEGRRGGLRRDWKRHLKERHGVSLP